MHTIFSLCLFCSAFLSPAALLMPWKMREKKLKMSAYCVSKLGEIIDVSSAVDSLAWRTTLERSTAFS